MSVLYHLRCGWVFFREEIGTRSERVLGGGYNSNHPDWAVVVPAAVLVHKEERHCGWGKQWYKVRSNHDRCENHYRWKYRIRRLECIVFRF